MITALIPLLAFAGPVASYLATVNCIQKLESARIVLVAYQATEINTVLHDKEEQTGVFLIARGLKNQTLIVKWQWEKNDPKKYNVVLLTNWFGLYSTKERSQFFGFFEIPSFYSDIGNGPGADREIHQIRRSFANHIAGSLRRFPFFAQGEKWAQRVELGRPKDNPSYTFCEFLPRSEKERTYMHRGQIVIDKKTGLLRRLWYVEPSRNTVTWDIVHIAMY